MTISKYQRLWQTVMLIPSGKVATYGQVADLAGLPGRARMVGKALGAAPDTMAVPWYRVLKSNGQLAFEKGSRASSRQTGLLQEEGVVVLNNRVKLKDFQWQPGLDDILLRLNF